MGKMTKKLYTLVHQLGLVENNNPDDDFHTIVFRVTGKLHVSELTENEEKMVLDELLEMKRIKENPDKISQKHIDKVWALIYELCSVDPSDATPFERLRGALKKILNTSSARSDPFMWVREKDADRLINTLQGYVKSAKKKNKK